MLNIALAHNWLKTSLAIVKLQAALVQALPPTASPLRQLPDISHEQAQELEIVKGAEGKKWAEKAVKQGLVEGDAKAVAEYWPKLDISEAGFKGELSAVSFLRTSSYAVIGERIVTPSSIVSLTFQARYVYPTTSLPKPAFIANGHLDTNKSNGDVREASVSVIEDDLEKVEPEDAVGDIKEKIVETVSEAVEETKQAVKVGKKGKKPVKDEKTWAPNGYAFAPHWPAVSRRDVFAKRKADGVAAETSFPGIVGRLKVGQGNCATYTDYRYSPASTGWITV